MREVRWGNVLTPLISPHSLSFTAVFQGRVAYCLLVFSFGTLLLMGQHTCACTHTHASMHAHTYSPCGGSPCECRMLTQFSLQLSLKPLEVDRRVANRCKARDTGRGTKVQTNVHSYHTIEVITRKLKVHIYLQQWFGGFILSITLGEGRQKSESKVDKEIDFICNMHCTMKISHLCFI